MEEFKKYPCFDSGFYCIPALNKYVFAISKTGEHIKGMTGLMSEVMSEGAAKLMDG